MNFIKSQILNFVLILIFICITYGAFRFDSAGTLFSIGESLSHFVTALINCIPVIFILWFFTWIRSLPFFDENGCHSEMKKIQERVGTEYEGNWDSIAVAIKYGTTTLFIGALFVGFFS